MVTPAMRYFKRGKPSLCPFPTDEEETPLSVQHSGAAMYSVICASISPVFTMRIQSQNHNECLKPLCRAMQLQGWRGWISNFPPRQMQTPIIYPMTFAPTGPEPHRIMHTLMAPLVLWLGRAMAGCLMSVSVCVCVCDCAAGVWWAA